MSEEQLKATEEEVTEREEVNAEEISEDDLEGVAGGVSFGANNEELGFVCTCGEDNCDCMSCDSEATAD